MKTIIFLAALTSLSIVTAQDTAHVFIVEDQLNVPLNEWYVFEKEVDENIYYMDFDNAVDAEIQIDKSLSEMDAIFESGTLVDLGDGLFYIEWDGVGYDEEGNEYPAYFVYMYSSNNPYFHRISVQYLV
jgi:hypothetical protein